MSGVLRQAVIGCVLIIGLPVVASAQPAPALDVGPATPSSFASSSGFPYRGAVTPIRATASPLLWKYSFQSPFLTSSMLGGAVASLGDISDDGVPDYLMSNNYVQLELRSPLTSSTDLLWTRDMIVNPGALTSDCDADIFGTLAPSGIYTFGLLNQVSTAAVADPFLSVVGGGVPFLNIGVVCIIDPRDGSYISHIVGFSSFDRFGTSVLTPGDLDGDGQAELLIGAPNSLRRPFNDFQNAVNSGAVYLFQGSDILTYANNAGFVPATAVAAGSEFGSEFGTSLGLLGTQNQRTYFIAGAPKLLDICVDVFGIPVCPFPGGLGGATIYELSTNLSGSLVMVPRTEIQGPAIGQQFGLSVAAVRINASGDYNLFIGAPLGGDGRVYVYRAVYQPLQPNFLATQIGVVSGEQLGSRFGWSLKNIGDFDGDGVDDVATTAPGYVGQQAHGAGKAYVISGSSLQILDSIEYNGYPFDDVGGTSIVDGGPDIDQDGLSDLIIGAPAESQFRGAAHLWGQ